MKERGVVVKSGFITALGTPVDENGNFIEESFKKQMEDQIQAGAVGVLVMGSMGQQAYLRTSECTRIAKVAVKAAAGRIPVFVGAMDLSIDRVRERIADMENLDITAIVFTTSYYSIMSRHQIINFCKGLASATMHNIMLYDLPRVTQSKITYDIVLELIRDIPNLVGIKSADLKMLRKLKLNKDVPENFNMFYSDLDTFDIAYKWGLDKCLDGMFSCTPVNAGKMFKAMAERDFNAAATYLNNIIYIRDLFLDKDIWPAFTAAMNMLGYEGRFNPDYCGSIRSEYVEEIYKAMHLIGEL